MTRRLLGRWRRCSGRSLRTRLPPLEDGVERLSVEVLHDEELDVAFTADVIERADMRVGERGDRACLALKPLECGVVPLAAAEITLIAT